jgi:hypothetical protein
MDGQREEKENAVDLLPQEYRSHSVTSSKTGSSDQRIRGEKALTQGVGERKRG